MNYILTVRFVYHLVQEHVTSQTSETRLLPFTDDPTADVAAEVSPFASSTACCANIPNRRRAFAASCSARRLGIPSVRRLHDMVSRRVGYFVRCCVSYPQSGQGARICTMRFRAVLNDGVEVEFPPFAPYFDHFP